MPDLDVQIRELVTGVEPVTAAEVIAAHQQSPSPSRANPRFGHPRRMRSYAMGAVAMATAICVLVVVLVFGVSGSKPTPTTTKPGLSQWPERTIASTGQAQDVAPTSKDVYWLNQGVASKDGAPVTVFRYDPVSGQVTRGPSTTGFLGTSALAVTGGWVWIVVGVGDDVVVEQLDTSTLALRTSESLPVKNNVFRPPVLPVLTATDDGPLWVAGGEDLWALNPTTGAVKTEFDTGNEILSMSTNPTGSLLYTGGQITFEGGMSVTEYDAQTGREIERADKSLALEQALHAGSVAATNSGVWVSVRSGMAGDAFELSAHGLNVIAPPPSKGGPFGTYDQIMGVGSSISEQTLWLTSEAQVANLTCADPTTGALRASESTPVPVFAPIASGHTLYAVTGLGAVVVITPPAKCFG